VKSSERVLGVAAALGYFALLIGRPFITGERLLPVKVDAWTYIAMHFVFGVIFGYLIVFAVRVLRRIRGI
jgi:hypothetical protein